MMGSYDLIDARIAYKPENGHWGVELACKEPGRYAVLALNQSYLAGYARYYVLCLHLVTSLQILRSDCVAANSFRGSPPVASNRKG